MELMKGGLTASSLFSRVFARARHFYLVTITASFFVQPCGISPLTEHAISFTFEWPCIHCKKRLAVFPSPAGISPTKLSLDGKKLTIPVQGEFGKLRLG